MECFGVGLAVRSKFKLKITKILKSNVSPLLRFDVKVHQLFLKDSLFTIDETNSSRLIKQLYLYLELSYLTLAGSGTSCSVIFLMDGAAFHEGHCNNLLQLTVSMQRD